MVSFAAPGGGAGPHKDNYDVFLCQGIGVRNWRFTNDDVPEDPAASDELALLCEFAGDEDLDAAEGDVLYLPPGVPHWGTARRACMTYSIGMRAPQVSDFSSVPSCSTPNKDDFYRDPDLAIGESRPGYLSRASAKRASLMLALATNRQDEVAEALGRFATQPKDWLRPDVATAEETEGMLHSLRSGGRLQVHGMSQIAFDEHMIYVNGSSKALPRHTATFFAQVCVDRSLSQPPTDSVEQADLLRWMLEQDVFEIPENP